jgi:hypothetical protein
MRDFRIRVRSIIVCTMLCAASAGAAAPAVREVAFKNPIREFIDSQERVSGEAVTGVVFSVPGTEQRSNDLFAFTARPVASVLLELTTVDGRYFAEIEYDVNASAGEWLELELPASSIASLKGIDQQGVAALLTVRDDGTILPLRWSEPGATAHVRTYLNTERATAFYLDRARTARGPCRTPSTPSTFKFDQLCDVPVEAIDTAGGRIEIERRSGVRRLSPVIVSIAIDGGDVIEGGEGQRRSRVEDKE